MLVPLLKNKIIVCSLTTITKVREDLRAKSLYESVNKKSFELIMMNLLDDEFVKGEIDERLVICYFKIPRIRWD